MGIEKRFERWSCSIEDDGLRYTGYAPTDGLFAKYEISRDRGEYKGSLYVQVTDTKYVEFREKHSWDDWRMVLSGLLVQADQNGVKVPGLVPEDKEGSPQVVRFEIESDDGTITRLTGEAAAEWARQLNSEVALSQIRSGRRLSPPEFETFKRENGKDES